MQHIAKAVPHRMLPAHGPTGSGSPVRHDRVIGKMHLARRRMNPPASIAKNIGKLAAF